MKNEDEIIKLMDLLYGEGAADAAADKAWLQEHPELAQELEDLQEVRGALQSIPIPDAPMMPWLMPTPVAPAPVVRKLSWPYWAAASIALVVFGFLLAKIQVRFDEGEMTLAFGKTPRPAQIQVDQPQTNALTAADTQAIQELVRAELASHYTQLEQTIASAQVNLRKDNDTQRLQLVNQLQSELSALNKQQQEELTALVAATQADNLGKMVTAMNDAHSQQQEKIKWVLQQGFIDWNIKREQDLDRIKDEFNKVYAQVHYQKLEQDKFNRVIIQQTNN
ncbi:hypothetical protein [Haliscomenobacter sp.]|uniref:anti-sigma factor family protein n=1 Tax=Haliscomenobacter sp. TaxID=2717303 RepID=UPI003BA983F0